MNKYNYYYYLLFIIMSGYKSQKVKHDTTNPKAPAEKVAPEGNQYKEKKNKEVSKK